MTIGVSFDAEQLDQVRTLASSADYSMSQLVRFCIRHALECPEFRQGPLKESP